MVANRHSKVKVTVDLRRLAKRLSGRVISVQTLAEMLGVDSRTAGKVLSKMSMIGLARRVSKRAYIVSG